MRIDYKLIVFKELPVYARSAINEILDREGGNFVDHPNDWPTKWGIRQLSADRAGYTGRIEDIDRDTAARIWASLFWFGPNIHRIAEVSPLIAQTVLDTSGPAGLPTGITHLQKALTAHNAILGGKRIYGDDLVIDGLIGDKTIRMLETYLSHRERDNGERKLAALLNSLQAAHFVDVALRLPKKRSFTYGWNSQRVFVDLIALADDTDSLTVA